MLSLRKTVVFVILLLVIIFGFLFISSSSKSIISNIKSVSFEAEKKSCEINSNCEIIVCGNDKNPNQNYECTDKEKNKWEAMKVYLKDCEQNETKCDALTNAILKAKNNEGSNLEENNNDLISVSNINEFTKSDFYKKYYTKFEKFASKNNFDVKILYAIIINEGAYGKSFENSVRFECHKFNEEEGWFTREVPCTLKNGESFSRIKSETNYDAYLVGKNRDAKLAFKSSSFGFAQMMGFNYMDLGLNIDYDNGLDKLKDVNLQIEYFFKFLEKNNFINIFQKKSWDKIAKKYNGKQYAKNNYNNKLENNYNIIIV